MLSGSGALGLVIGSFLNVVIFRLPAGQSVVRPRSRCPACGRWIPWYENIPVLSFLALRGRCRGCGGRISWRYPLVEILTGVIFAAAAWLLVVRWREGVYDPVRLGTLAAGFLYLGALLALTFIDLDHRILPDRITKPGMAAGAILSVAIPSLQDPRGPAGLPPEGQALLLSLAGMAAGYGSLRVVGFLGEKAFRKEAMGLGDCKLLAMIGAFTGPAGAGIAAALGILLGLLMGGGRMLLTGDPSFPFGPALAVGGGMVFLDRAGVEAVLLEGIRLCSDPRGQLAVLGVLGALLLGVRSRLPRAVFLLLLVLVLGMAALNLRLLF